MMTKNMTKKLNVTVLVNCLFCAWITFAAVKAFAVNVPNVMDKKAQIAQINAQMVQLGITDKK